MNGYPAGTKVMLILGPYVGDTGSATGRIEPPGRTYRAADSGRSYVDPDWTQLVLWDDGLEAFAPINWLIPIDENPDKETIETEDEVMA